MRLWTPTQKYSIRRALERFAEDGAGPVKFANRIIRVTPSGQQADMLAAVGGFRPGSGRIGVSVKSGRGTGKTWAAAWAILWKLTCFKDALVVATAPKERQLFDVLWANCQRFIDGSPILRQVLDWQATRIRVRGGAENWHAVARTAKAAVNMAGQHAPHMLFMVEEASGVEDPILNGLIAGMTEADNQMVLVSQGRKASGVFFESHNRMRSKFETLTFDARHSPFVSDAWVETMREIYGEQSPMFAVEVAGDFPDQGEMSAFALAWLLDARERESTDQEDERVKIGVDVARYGSDDSVIAARRGGHLLRLEAVHGNDTQQVAGLVVATINELREAGYGKQGFLARVDTIGVGAGTYDRLVETQDDGKLDDVELVECNVAEASSDPEKYYRLRDELWLRLADRYRTGEISYNTSIAGAIIDRLQSELLPVEYGFSPATGARRMESKEEMKRHSPQRRSPDVADAVCMAYFEDGGEAVQVGFL